MFKGAVVADLSLRICFYSVIREVLLNSNHMQKQIVGN